MMLRAPHEQALLTGAEIALVRQVLADCAQLLERAHSDAGPPAGALLAEATRAAAGGRSPDGLIYYINLAIDYLDFAPAPRRRP